MAQTRNIGDKSKSKRKGCCCVNVNNLPSIWFGIVSVALQAYISLQGGKQFLEYMDSKFSSGITDWEKILYISLQGTAVLLLPVLAFASIFKLGNLANDGFRLGRHLDLEMDLDLPRPKTRDPLITSGSACGAAWRHCPPLGPSIHAFCALCSLIAKLVLEARLIKDGLVSRDHIWNTDLDMIFMHSFWPEPSVSAAQIARKSPFPSPEFLSYTLALLGFAIRSSDVYWGVNKCFAFLMSLQLTANAVCTLLVFSGASILYKVELVGVPASFSGVAGSLSDYLLLDPPITVMLSMLLSVTLLLACCPLSMYALNKLSAFLMKTRKRYMQELPAARSYLWSFYPHLAALASLLALAACCAPILHDLSRLYKLSPQPILLAAVTGSIVHAFLWVALWLLLTAKTNWDFRLKISVGRTLLRSPSCLALAAQVDFSHDKRNSTEEAESLLNDVQPPILVFSAGKAYNISDNSVQRKIQQLITNEQEAHADGSKEGTGPHQVYWLRGNAGPTDIQSPTATGSPISPTLPEPSICTSIQHGDPRAAVNQQQGLRGSVAGTTVLSPILSRPVRKPLLRIPGGTEDDGDYATLRDLPLVTLPEEPIADTSHETSSSSDGADSGYSHKERCPAPTSVHSPRLTRDLCNPYGYVKPKMITFAALPGQSNTIGPHPTGNNPTTASLQQSPFHSLPMGHRPPNQVQIHRFVVEERRPAIQACLFAGHGLESNQRP